MKSHIIFFFLFLLLSSNILSQSVNSLEYYKRIDSLSNELIKQEFKKDSLDNLIIYNLSKANQKKESQVRVLQKKNLIFCIGLATSVVIIAFIQ